MKTNLLARHWNLENRQVLDLQSTDFVSYITFLYLVARAGGFTVEEEVFLEAWAASFSIDPSLCREALAKAREIEDIEEFLPEIPSPLQKPAFLDTLCVVTLDGEITAREKRILDRMAEVFDLPSAFVTEARKIILRDSQLLRIACEIACAPDPATHRHLFVAASVHRIRPEKRLLIPEPEKLPVAERSAAIALLVRFCGVNWRRSGAEDLITEVAECLGLDAAHLCTAEAEAFSFQQTTATLAARVTNRGLQIGLYRDLHRLLGIDAHVSEGERIVLQELAGSFGISSEHQQMLNEHSIPVRKLEIHLASA